MIEVDFEHWVYTFPDDLLTRYGSRYHSRKDAGEVFCWEINRTASRACRHGLPFSEDQVLGGNAAFPEAAVADPIADLEVWDEWKAGWRDFPYPGRYSELGITKQEDKTSSPSSVGVLGEIMAEFFAQAGVAPWVLVRVVRRWPDFILSDRGGLYSFVESKAFTGEPEGDTHLGRRVPGGHLSEASVDAAQQLTSDPHGKVWYSFTHIVAIRPMRLAITFLEFKVSEGRWKHQPRCMMPDAVADGLAERAVNQAAAKLDFASLDSLRAESSEQRGRALGEPQGLAEVEVENLLAELTADDVRAVDREPIMRSIADIVDSIYKKAKRGKRMPDSRGERLRQAQERAADGRLSELRRLRNQAVLLADLSILQQTGARRAWSAD
jgi:hypothetical protein